MSVSSVSSARPLADVRGVRVPQGTLGLLRDLVHDHSGMYYDDQRQDVLADRLTPLALARGFAPPRMQRVGVRVVAVRRRRRQ